jgi:hypothetical protein
MPVDYSTFSDNDITLPRPNGDIDTDVAFSTPGVDTSKNGVLSLQVNPTSGTPTLEVKINGTTVLSSTFGNNVKRVVQENFGQSILNANNTLTLKVTGNGSISASDFHVLYTAA